MAIRVIRLLEYTYVDQEACDKDMRQWQAPAMGIHQFSDKCVVRSSVTFPETIPIPDKDVT